MFRLNSSSNFSTQVLILSGGHLTPVCLYPSSDPDTSPFHSSSATPMANQSTPDLVSMSSPEHQSNPLYLILLTTSSLSNPSKPLYELDAIWPHNFPVNSTKKLSMMYSSHTAHHIPYSTVMVKEDFNIRFRWRYDPYVTLNVRAWTSSKEKASKAMETEFDKFRESEGQEKARFVARRDEEQRLVEASGLKTKSGESAWLEVFEIEKVGPTKTYESTEVQEVQEGVVE